MAGDLDVAVRLSMQGADQVRAELTDLGAVGADSLNRLEGKATEASTRLSQSLTGIGDEGLRAADTAGSAMTGLVETATSALGHLEGVALQSFGRFEDALIDLTFRGRLRWRAMAEGMAEDFARLVLRQTVTQPLASAATAGLRGLTGSLFAGIFHDGGTVGDPDRAQPHRAAPAHLFADAPRLHSGTLPRLAPDEVPAILQTGEMVLNRRQADAVRAADDLDEQPAPAGIQTAPPARGGDTYVIQVDARGADSEGDIEARVERAVAVALAQQVPGIVRTSSEIARRRVVDDYRRRGGRFG